MLEEKEHLFVYVVDSDDSVRNSLSRLMRANNLSVKAFASPQELLDELRDDADGCLLLDVATPGTIGPHLRARLQGKGIGLPIIALTSRDGADISEAAHAIGAGIVLHKPVDGQALLDAIAWFTYTVKRSKRN